MLTQSEIIVFLLTKFDLPPLRSELTVRAAFFVREELFLPNRVIAGLFVLVDLAFIKKALQNSLNNFFVSIARCLRPAVVLHVEFLPEINKLVRNVFDKLSRRNSSFRRRLLDFLTVLIDAGQKENFLAFEPVIARNHIG